MGEKKGDGRKGGEEEEESKKGKVKKENEHYVSFLKQEENLNKG